MLLFCPKIFYVLHFIFDVDRSCWFIKVVLSSVESETNSFYFKIKCHKDFSTKPKNHCKAYVVKKENIVRTEYSPKPFFTLLKVYQYFWEALEVTSSSKNLLRVLLHNAKVNIQNKSSEINVGAKLLSMISISMYNLLQ